MRLMTSVGNSQMYFNLAFPFQQLVINSRPFHLQAIREVNNRTDVLQNVTLGFVMFDDCYKDVTALAQALHFIHDGDSGVYFHEDYDARLCPATTVEAYEVIGLIGSESSTTTIQIANLLTSFDIPMISYLATASPLSYKIKYPDFYRTVPTDSIQARVIMELLAHFNWSHVSVVYTKGTYGEQAFAALDKMATYYDVCFASTYVIDDTWKSGHYKTMVFEMMQEIYARIIIVFTPLQEALQILKAAKVLKAEGRLTWIAGEAWGKSINELYPLAEYAWGAFSVNIKASNVERFDEYFQSITPNSTNVNPWIEDFWRSEFGRCRPKYSRKWACDQTKTFLMSPKYAPERTVSLVYDAVYSYVHAIEEIAKRPECKSKLNETRDQYVECLKRNVRLFLRNVTFEGETANVQYLRNFGYTKRHYEIYNLQNGTNGFEWVKLGLWNKTSTRLEMDNITIQWAPYFKGEKPKSLCSQPCGIGEEMVLQQRRCCWTCEACEANERTYHKHGQKITSCTPCHNGTWPDPLTRTKCEPIIAEYLRWHQPLGIVLAGLASLGLTFCVIIIIVFASNNDKPLVKASSRELSYFMLISLMISYAFTFSFLLKPSTSVCFTRLLGISLCFTLMYAPLFTKTMRIYRLFEAGHAMNRKPTCVSSKSQICIVLNIIVFHVSIIIIHI